MDKKKNMGIEGKVARYMAQHEMLRAQDCVLVGVSGGADSLALLDMLASLRGGCLQEVYGIHVHHGIRGKEADEDAAFVEKFCEEREIPCHIFYRNIPEQAKTWKIGEEEAGRRVRYEIFEKERLRLQEKKGCTVKIAVAHHGDDLAETMLHHMARGTGLRGLGAIRPVQGALIRPFLCLERREIEDYLKEKNLAYRTDSTNFSTEYTRNRIRLGALKSLKEEINPKATAHMRELAELAVQADLYLAEIARERLEKLCSFSEEEVFLPLVFFEERQILVQYGIRQILEEFSGKSQDLSANHIEAVKRLAKRQVGRMVSLPYQIQVSRTYDGLLFKKKEENFDVQKEKGLFVEVPSTISVKNAVWEFQIFCYIGQKIPQKIYTKWLDYDKIKGRLCIRSRRPGDYLVIDQEGSRKKLNRYFIDEKIPIAERENRLFLALDQEVLWIPGGRISEHAKINKQTKRILEIKYEGEKEHERESESIDQ